MRQGRRRNRAQEIKFRQSVPVPRRGDTVQRQRGQGGFIELIGRGAGRYGRRFLQEGAAPVRQGREIFVGQSRQDIHIGKPGEAQGLDRVCRT